ncbi:uncharacterized protein LOC128176544 isoform X2 [Crassostrea angulata]|uniref:uncharacterized protein LOC128176544 isoform X2 n=1 Tax=Magallana angulata TaxID=2784310 RepID=UPI0022B0AD0D|nr:uncharacterized protein LOC128176544 isoform X2 [Crassostrea angulata]
MGNSTSITAVDHTDQNIYVGSSVDPPTSQNLVISHELRSAIKNSSIVSLEEGSVSKEKTIEMSKSFDTSLNSHEKNEIYLDTMLQRNTEERTTMSPYKDVSQNIESLKKKEDSLSFHTVCKESHTDCVSIAFTSNDSLFCASVESTLQKGEHDVENHLECSCCKAKSTSCIEENIPINKQSKIAILQMVQRCNESLESLEKDHKVLFNVMNSRSISQSELKERGLKIMTELENILKNHMAKMKENDDVIPKLQTILSNLNKKVELLEKKIQVLEFEKAKTQKTAMQESNILVHQNEEAPTTLNLIPLKPILKPATEEKSFSLQNIEVDLASKTIEQGNEDVALCDSERAPDNCENLTQMEILPVGYWVGKANEILATIALEGPVDNVCGQCNVLCLDTSDSMAGEAFQTMINLSLRFLSEYSSSSQKVGLVCFGGNTAVISRCCMNYTKLKEEIKTLRPGGPSPLTAGILLSHSVASSGVTIPTLQGVSFFPRIIVLTDGVATLDRVTGCADFTPDRKERLMICSDMNGLAEMIRQSSHRIYCVPLGKADESIIEPLVRRTHGKIVRPANFDKLIYQFEGELLATKLRPYFSNFRHVEPDMVMAAVQSFDLSLRGVDLEDLVEYIHNPPPQKEDDSDDEDVWEDVSDDEDVREDDSDDEDDNDDYIETDINMPPIGTRVRRGPDWQSNFDEQDSRGPGTVVSHDRRGFISIIWDNGHQCQYPYGIQGRFAVIVVDEPRILQRDQLIEVGCLVKRGNNWRDNDNDGGPENIGVVFRVHSDATVSVRWPTGQRRRYKYGKQGYFEVELCDPLDENVQLRILSGNTGRVHTRGNQTPS